MSDRQIPKHILEQLINIDNQIFLNLLHKRSWELSKKSFIKQIRAPDIKMETEIGMREQIQNIKEELQGFDKNVLDLTLQKEKIMKDLIDEDDEDDTEFYDDDDPELFF